MAFAALDDAIPLYPVYALLFAAHGLSAGQISGLFVVWSSTAIALEVPSGAWADRVSRRRLLALGQVVRGLGFGLWTFLPSYPAFAAGFVLWGVGGSLTSGTEQAVVYDGLAAVGRAADYPRLMGLAGTARLLGDSAAVVLATPLLVVGGFRLAGAVSVAVCLVAAAVALSFPEPARAGRVDGSGGGPGEVVAGDGAAADSDEGGYLATLRAGLREAAGRRVVRAAVLLAALLPGLWAADEYLPLLADADGVPLPSVPLVLLPMVLAQAAATALAGRCARMRPVGVAALVAAGAACLAAGALVRHPAGFVAITAAMAALSLASVLVDARLQDAITGPARATVTSVAGFGAEVTSVLLYAAYAAGASAGLDVATLVAVFAAPIGLVALATPRWLPAPRPPTTAPGP